MILTPTYHVFRMFKHHQGAQCLNSFITDAGEAGIDEYKVPEVTESVSESADGTINITLNNLSLDDGKEVLITFDAFKASSVEASVVTGEMNAHNTFDKPEVVTTGKLDSVRITEEGIVVKLPAKSVSLLRVR
jgi:alpha-N-arabinofuranosidase